MDFNIREDSYIVNSTGPLLQVGLGGSGGRDRDDPIGGGTKMNRIQARQDAYLEQMSLKPAYGNGNAKKFESMKSGKGDSVNYWEDMDDISQDVEFGNNGRNITAQRLTEKKKAEKELEL